MARPTWIGLACVVILAGCAAPGQFPGDAVSSRGPAAANPVFATQIAGPATLLAPMPTAVAVLKPGDLNRNRAFCSAITSRLPTAQQAMAASVVAPNIILTRWLTQLPEMPAARATDCDFLVGTYDYARRPRHRRLAPDRRAALRAWPVPAHGHPRRQRLARRRP